MKNFIFLLVIFMTKSASANDYNVIKADEYDYVAILEEAEIKIKREKELNYYEVDKTGYPKIFILQLITTYEEEIKEEGLDKDMLR